TEQRTQPPGLQAQADPAQRALATVDLGHTLDRDVVEHPCTREIDYTGRVNFRVRPARRRDRGTRARACPPDPRAAFSNARRRCGPPGGGAPARPARPAPAPGARGASASCRRSPFWPDPRPSPHPTPPPEAP